MMESAERVSYIAEYIAAYESKIKLCNKNGLFDSAKLFELFAIEVCALWFGQKFQNLNTTIPNYPYVDLLSDDRQIFVQVSTAQNVPTKIKDTLENIKNGKKEYVSDIKEVYFFVLHNESIDDVKDYAGDSRIGKIDFEQAKHLITTQKIVARAMSDIEFQKALYDLLERENKRVYDLSNKLAIEFENSKSIGLSGIDTFINNEYEIDRTCIVEKIKTSKSQFISVRGEAGSGKSVVCKKVVEDEACLLFARAERFVEETDIDDIWHLNISEVLAYLNQRKVIFFIDSLEFIADASKSKLDLLQSLYELVSKYPNAKIITSCRSCDATAFFAIDSKYSIEAVLIDRLSAEELNKIAEKYPIIDSFRKEERYSDLIGSPFYINLIVKNVADYSSITDENKLRALIWENAICLRNKTSKYDVLFNDVVDEINKIVFERAKTFSLGVPNESINQKVLRALISENVIVENNGTVRLKYDIFEDICFEQNIDREFDLCRGVYSQLFDKIEVFGRCCYRRYQIWISNKIFTKTSRDKFLYNLLFSKNLPDKWTKQTIIGLVKSRFCTSFFEEQENNLIEKDMLQRFIDITNLYAFEAQVLYFSPEPYFSLKPQGAGRAEIIRIIFKNELYKESGIKSDAIIKLCSDYAKNKEYDFEIGKMACLILAYYIDSVLNDDKIMCYQKSKRINPLLTPIYLMSEVSKDWIIMFWKKQMVEFSSTNHDTRRIAEEIFENTLDMTPYKLTKNLPHETCDLATKFWTTKFNVPDSYMFYDSGIDSVGYQYGLNKNAESYGHSTDSLHVGNFLNSIFTQNFWIGLSWAIDFINNAVDCFVKQNSKDVGEIEINFLEKGTSKRYYAIPVMWFAGSQEGHFPVLLGDIVYVLRSQILSVIKSAIHENIEYNQFAFLVKKAILEKSNSITLFPIIADIGIEFEKELPGYALDLATSIELIYWDIDRYVTLNPGDQANALKATIFAIVGVPNLKGRYEGEFKKQFNLQEYVSHMQLDSRSQVRCHQILDYLYSLYPNDESNAHAHLQIQKMDLRTSEVEIVDHRTISISPVVTGEAKKIVDANIEHNKPKNTIDGIIRDFLMSTDFENLNNISVNDINEKIDQILSQIEKVDLPFVYVKYMIILISIALNKEELEQSRREEYCEFWLDGVESIFENENFEFEYGYLFVLFRQVDADLCLELKNRIKKLILRIICYNGQNGLIGGRLLYVTKGYLKTNESLATALFNTIIALSFDEYQHQLFNYNYMVEHYKDEGDEFIPNLTPKLKGIDYRLSQEGAEGYVSHRDEYIEKYLFKEECADLTDFDINKHDLNTLCNIVNTGVCLQSDKDIVLKELLKGILGVYTSKRTRHKSSDILDFMSAMKVSSYLGDVLFKNSTKVLEIMFDFIDFSIFSQEAISFYLKVFHTLLCKYVDSHSDYKLRKQCESILLELEDKINSKVSTSSVKHQLYRALILSADDFDGDWSKIKTGYKFADVQFLNGMFEKYGKYNFKYFIYTIYKMHYRDLLPHILTSVSYTLLAYTKEKLFDEDDFKEVEKLIDNMAVVAFLNYHDEIKQDEELSTSYENMLEILVDLRFENAAVLLDEFRIH